LGKQVEDVQELSGPGMHCPNRQKSFWVQGSLSSQGMSEKSFLHPVSVSHVSVVHPFPSSQLFGALPTQTPALQRSPMVHSLPSSQGRPSSMTIWVHSPVDGTQAAFLHGLFPASGQTTTEEAGTLQVPKRHFTVPLHLLLSLNVLQSLSTIHVHSGLTSPTQA